MNKWNNKFRYKVASRWLFILSHTTMHGSMNIKKNTIKISLIISVEISICEGKKYVNFQSKSIMKTCRIDDDVIFDTVL